MQKSPIKPSKMTLSLQNTVARMQRDNTPADDICLRVIFNTHAAATLSADKTQFLDATQKPVTGVAVRCAVTADIFTADVSLNGLRAMDADARVKSIDGSRPVQKTRVRRDF